MTAPRRVVPRIGVTALFLALLATPLLLGRRSDTAGTVDRAEALERFGFHLEEVSGEIGIRFLHRAPRLDPRLDHILPEIASAGAAVSVVDFDRDGWADLYVTNSAVGSHNALYRNLGDGTFEDVAPALGVADANRAGTGVSMGAVWGDWDNDGWEDLFLYKWGRPELFHNDEGRGFTRVSEAAGLPAWINAGTAVWLDFDRDGFLDLFVGGYFPETLDLWRLPHTRILPESYEYAANGGRDWLLRNLGDGRFEDVAERVGLGSNRWTLAAVAADLRGTGWPDLVVANDYGVDEVWWNEEGRRFVAAGETSGIGFRPESGMSASAGDVLNRGEVVIHVSNITEEGILLQGNGLWVPAGVGPGGAPRYEDLAAAMGVEAAGWSYGAQFGDLDNDGDLDLVVVNGFVSGDRGTSYWYDFSSVALGHRRIIEDARNWPPIGNRSHAGHQRSRVWLSDGAGSFVDVAQGVGVTDRYDGRAVALVDLWNRGVLDLVVANQRGPLLVYRTTAARGRDWIAFELEGSDSNRSAIGARVTLRWNGTVQVQEVSGGSGFSAQNQRRLHFGLGPGARVEKAEIRWPSGGVQVLASPEVGRVHRIREPSP